MDGERFDAVVRALSAGISRRGALAVLAGLASVFGPRPTADAQKKKGKGKGAGKGKAKDKGKSKAKKGRAAGQVSSEAVDCLSPGPDANMSGCNFNNEDFAGIDLSSSSMVGTRFRGTDLCGADLSSSNLRNADFRGFPIGTGSGRPTNLFRADLSSSACGGVLFNARTLFCRTKTCNGAFRDDDCPAGVAPDDVCCSNTDCAPPRVCEGGVCQPCDVCLPAGACQFSSLAAAVAAAPANTPSTIRICPGRYPTKNVQINKPLTIIGAGSGTTEVSNTLLDGENDNRVLEIFPGATVTVQNLRMERGHATGPFPASNGGGIHNHGALTLEGVAVANCTADEGGGGIESFGGALILTDSDIDSNTAVGFVGGGIHVTGGEARLLRTTVRRNTAPIGGGIDNTFGTTVRLQTGTRITGNTATADGGGGLHVFVDGTLIMEAGSVVANNRAPAAAPGGQGGGILNLGTSTLMPGSSVTENEARTGGGVFQALGAVDVQAAGIVVDNTLLDGTTINNCQPALTNCPTNTN